MILPQTEGRDPQRLGPGTIRGVILFQLFEQLPLPQQGRRQLRRLRPQRRLQGHHLLRGGGGLGRFPRSFEGEAFGLVQIAGQQLSQFRQ